MAKVVTTANLRTAVVFLCLWLLLRFLAFLTGVLGAVMETDPGVNVELFGKSSCVS